MQSDQWTQQHVYLLCLLNQSPLESVDLLDHLKGAWITALWKGGRHYNWLYVIMQHTRACWIRPLASSSGGCSWGSPAPPPGPCSEFAPATAPAGCGRAHACTQVGRRWGTGGRPLTGRSRIAHLSSSTLATLLVRMARSRRIFLISSLRMRISSRRCEYWTSPLLSVECCILTFSYSRASSSLRRISCAPRMSLSLMT